MKNNTLSQNDHSIYPGEYAPLFKIEQIEQELENNHENDTVILSTTIKELADSYVVTLVVPGFKREDFIVTADGNLLSVYMLHKDFETEVDERNDIPVQSKCFIRKIRLPENADTEFIHADYIAGILNLSILKTDQQIGSPHATIIVY